MLFIFKFNSLLYIFDIKSGSCDFKKIISFNQSSFFNFFTVNKFLKYISLNNSFLINFLKFLISKVSFLTFGKQIFPFKILFLVSSIVSL